MTAVLGGGNDSKKAAEEARKQQQIAADRQLAELRASEQRAGATRRNPRGRRLFVADASQKSNLS